MNPRIFAATLADHGLTVVPRALGAVSTGLHFDTDPALDSFARWESEMGATFDDCYRCADEPAGRIDPLEPDATYCRPCLDEISHAAETRQYDAAMGASDDGWRAL